MKQITLKSLMLLLLLLIGGGEFCLGRGFLCYIFVWQLEGLDSY